MIRINRRYKTLRRVIITGPMSESHEAHAWAYKNGYRVMRSGPKFIKFLEVDPTRFKLVAEKVIPSN